VARWPGAGGPGAGRGPGRAGGECTRLGRQAPPMFEPDAESMPPERLAGLQQERLRGLIDRLLAAGGVQAARLTQAGVTSGADVTFDDLDRLPMTGKYDLWDGYPFGMLAVDLPDGVTPPGSSCPGG